MTHTLVCVSQQAQNICITFMECWTSVEDDKKYIVGKLSQAICLEVWGGAGIFNVIV